MRGIAQGGRRTVRYMGCAMRNRDGTASDRVGTIDSDDSTDQATGRTEREIPIYIVNAKTDTLVKVLTLVMPKRSPRCRDPDRPPNPQ